MSVVESAFADIPTKELRHLCDLIEAGTLRFPLTAARLRREGCGGVLAALGTSLANWDRVTLSLLAKSVLAERFRGRPQLQAVWSGPRPRGFLPRSTREALDELFASAKHDVLVMGYAFDQSDDIFRRLQERCAAGVRARFLVHLDDEGVKARASGELVQWRDAFLERIWPGEPYPEVFVDARAEGFQARFASVHAKAVVVDSERALVGSANFTSRGQDRNIELGVMLAAPDVAKDLMRLWAALVADNHVVQVSQGGRKVQRLHTTGETNAT